MTANQLAWLNYQETQRSNLAKEAETNRSNLVKEAETNRSNLENELLKEKQIYADSANKLLPGLGLATTEGMNLTKKSSKAKPGEMVGLLNVKMHGDVSKAGSGLHTVVNNLPGHSIRGKAKKGLESLIKKKKDEKKDGE